MLTYEEALAYINNFTNYEIMRQDSIAPNAMTLERPTALLHHMGNPQDRYPIVHIAGTKGKGSVAAMTASVLRAHGYKVGLYISPQLQDFRERFTINGELIPQEKLAALVEELIPHFDAIPGVTWFEVLTAIAFEYFAQEKVDIAVIEVGLGGRLDATTVCTPIVSVITSLSYDHMAILGNTIAEIAGEKAGIIKPNVPVVSAPQPPEAQAVIERIAAECHAPLTLIGRDWQWETHPPRLDGQTVTLTHQGASKVYTSGLLGEHQAINTAVVVATLAQVQPHLPISETAIQQGLKEVFWAGRLEITQTNPYVVLDSAHNRASAHYLKKALLALFEQRPRILVFGAKADKDILGMLDELLSIADTLIISQAVDARAETPDSIAHIARELGYTGEIITLAPIHATLDKARELAGENGMVCVTGSLAVVGEARQALSLPIGAKSHQ